MNVFFLDDDPHRHSVLRAVAQQRGVHLVAARTVDEALDALERERFDLILLDHDLDGRVFVPSGPGTGYEVACSIAGSINEGVPVIVHSLNEKGAMAMVEVLGESARWVPFTELHTALPGLLGA